MHSMHRFLVAGLLLFSLSVPVESSDSSPGEEPIITRIDGLLLARMKSEGVSPVGRAEDAEFLRRVSLDLAGTIPTVARAREFLADDSPDKRAKLVNLLLGSPATVNHLAEYWRSAMLPSNASPELLRSSIGLQNWLREQISNNMRYDRIVSDLIAATGSQEDGPAVFFTALDLEPKKLAAATARIFLGLQLECAECHDHPFDDWKQEDFWGYTAFFARLPKTDQMGMRQNFRLIDYATGEVTLPETDTVVLPKFPGGRAIAEGEIGTRRQQLSIWMSSSDNPYLARAAVNRVWAMLFGRGLVNPVDDLGPHNPASHPELLEELTDYFVDSGYDLKNLLRVLCSTEAYGRTSAIDPAAVPDPELFAAMAVKVQSAEQLYDSLSRTLSQGEQTERRFPQPPMDFRRQRFLTRMVSRTPDRTEYDRGLQQALLLMNGGETTEATDLEKSALLTSIEAPFLTPEQRIDILYLATLTRYPSENERVLVEHFIQDAGDDPNAARAAHADILWALLNSAEFTMNK